MKYKLKDICLINDLNIRNLSKDSIIQYLDTSSITCGQIESLKSLKLKDAPSRAQRMVSNDTIVYSMVRPNLCHYGYIETAVENMVVSTGFITIRVKPNFKKLIDCRYLYLQLTTPAITLYLQDIAQNAVSAYPSLNPSDIENLCFDFPTLEEQKAMSSAIHNIDRKIALNREINRNLEVKNFGITCSQLTRNARVQYFAMRVGSELCSNLCSKQKKKQLRVRNCLIFNGWSH